MPDASLQLDRAPPTLGQHGWDVLTQLGFDHGEIADLANRGVIKLPECLGTMPLGA